jgi:hypothetical protein
VGDAYMALEVCDTRDFDETLEEVVRDTRATERRSLSAQQAAEPQVVARRIERNLDKPDFTSPSGGVKPPLQQTDPPPERAWNWKGISYPPFGIEVSQSEGERARPSPAGGAVMELPARAGG